MELRDALCRKAKPSVKKERRPVRRATRFLRRRPPDGPAEQAGIDARGRAGVSCVYYAPNAPSVQTVSASGDGLAVRAHARRRCTKTETLVKRPKRSFGLGFVNRDRETNLGGRRHPDGHTLLR
jgi:hypothetical protein